jgi:CBS-domain-containing membrane protein
MPNTRGIDAVTQSVNRFVQPTARDLMRETRLLIPLGMSVGAAAELLEAAGGGAAPVVDSRGRCVGVFTAADYRRWLDRAGSDAEPARGRDPVAGRSPGDEVRYHVSGRYAAVMPDAGVPELLYRLDGAADPFLIVLDRQARPRGIVCALDVLVADSGVPVPEQPRPGPGFRAASSAVA